MMMPLESFGYVLQHFHAISSVCRLISRYSKIIESVIDNNKKYLEDSYNKNMS